jgi:hypothetical protein
MQKERMDAERKDARRKKAPAKLVYKKNSPLAQQAMKSFPLMLSQR